MAPRVSDRLKQKPFTPLQRLTVKDVAEIHAEVVELEDREVAARLDALEARSQQAASLTVSEPPIYGPGSGNSWFADIARTARPQLARGGGQAVKEAASRLERHELYQHRQDERRLAGALAAAEQSAYRALSRSRGEAALLQRWLASGGQLFETRSLGRTPGQGAYLTVPGWLVERFIHAPRAGAPFAALWERLDLPPQVSSVNLPRFTVGSGSGIQAIDATATPQRDPADSFLGCQVRTLAAQADFSMQWLDQSPVPPDETIGADLAEDFQMQLDAQLLMGNDGAFGQLPGVMSAGTFSASNMVWLSSTNNTAATSWANGAGATPAIAGSLHQMSAQLYSKISRYRALAPSHFVVPSSVWGIIAGSSDAQDRPLILPGTHDPDSVKTLHGIPVVEDMNIVETFGGSVLPSLSPVSAGRIAPTDGNGTWVPILLGRWSDCIYFQSEPVVELMDEVLSGSLQVRFRVRCYVAAAPGRVVWGGSSVSFSGTNQAGGVNNGAPVSYGALTNFTANSPLQPASAGY
jgi:HK97 family phage major capsid protein